MLDHSEASVASLAYALSSFQIPSVLWGHCFLQVHGIHSIVAVGRCDLNNTLMEYLN